MINLNQKFYILGSCVSRDIFRIAQKNEMVNSYIYHSSLISQLSYPPLEWKYDSLLSPDFTNFEKKSIKIDFEKTGIDLNKMLESIIIIDLVPEIYPLLKIGSTYITGSYLFNKASLKKHLYIDDTIGIRNEKRLELWIEACKEFRSLIPKKNRDNCILHKAFKAQYILEKDNRIYPYPENKELIISDNDYLSFCYNSFQDIVQPGYVIEVERSKIIANISHVWGKGRYHYTDTYYEECWHQIVDFCRIKKNGKCEPETPAIELITQEENIGTDIKQLRLKLDVIKKGLDISRSRLSQTKDSL